MTCHAYSVLLSSLALELLQFRTLLLLFQESIIQNFAQ